MDDDLALVYMWAYKKGEEKSKKRIKELKDALQMVLEAEHFLTDEYEEICNKANEVLERDDD
jgi:hypothetical protein